MGEMIFRGASSREVSQLNNRGEIDLGFARHPALTEDIRSLLAGMLRREPEKRFSAQEVVSHPFFRAMY